MRLIDADKLKPDMEIFTSAYSTELTKCYSKEAIDNAPTVNAEPIKHGKWIKHGGDKYPYYDCSECGNGDNMAMPYCAECGAKMDGGEENDSERIS